VKGFHADALCIARRDAIGCKREAGLRAFELEAWASGLTAFPCPRAQWLMACLNSITVAGAASALDYSAPTSRFTRQPKLPGTSRGCEACTREAFAVKCCRTCRIPPARNPRLKAPMLYDKHPLLLITYKWARRIAITVVGFTVLGVGIAMIVLPGPAIVVIPVGLGILGLEFAWARIWLKKIKERGTVIVQSIRRKRSP